MNRLLIPLCVLLVAGCNDAATSPPADSLATTIATFIADFARSTLAAALL